MNFLSFSWFKYTQLFILHSAELQGKSGSPRQVNNNIQEWGYCAKGTVLCLMQT